MKMFSKFCCKTFKGWFEEPDSESFYIRKTDEKSYFLNFSICFKDKKKQFERRDTVGILYCPWCGKKLS